MRLLLGRLVALGATAVVGCEKAPSRPAVIGFAFGWSSPSVVDVARAEMARSPASPAPEIRSATGMQVGEGPPAQISIASLLVAIPEVAGVVGHSDSRGTLMAAPVYDEARIPLVVPNSTSRRLRDAGPWVFSLAPDDSAEADFIAAFAARALHSRSAAVFYENDDYGIGLRDGLRAALSRYGVRLGLAEPIGNPCDPGRSDASIVRATPRGDPPDVAIIAGRTGPSLCLVRRLSARAPGLRFIAADGIEPDTAFLRALDPAAASAGCYVVTFWHADAPGIASAEFVSAYRRIVGQPPVASQALVFDALLLLTQAVREGGRRPDEVRGYLTRLGRARPAYEGVTGPISFGADRCRPLYMLRVRGGAATPVAAP
jgi:branched-chain amino acid transport system substrate-binding protein